MYKIKINPDAELVAEVRKALKENDGYCPCKLEHTLENKCMCQDFRELKEGRCHCGLYIKVILDEKEV